MVDGRSPSDDPRHDPLGDPPAERPHDALDDAPDDAPDDALDGAIDRLGAQGATGLFRARAATAAQAGLPEPSRLLAGRFRLEQCIGRGGVGEVWRAYDERLGREVAIKLLGPGLLERPALVERFVEEARIGARLQHPGTVPVHEVGVDERNLPFLVMRLVAGRTLAELLHDHAGGDVAGPLAWLLRVAEAVAYAHDRGIVHLDLKPQNVMVGSFGEVQVMDWGVAKALQGGVADAVGCDDPGAGGVVCGTPAYMAPEQARGETARIDERVDVFALGAMLCEVLTGAPPYPAGSRAATLAAAGRADLGAALRRLEQSAHEGDLVALAIACLAPTPEARLPAAGAVAQALSRHFADAERRVQQARVAGAEARVRAAEEARRLRFGRRVAVGVSFSAVLVLTWLWHLDAQDRERARRAEEQATEALQQAEQYAASSAWSAAIASLAHARDAAATAGEWAQQRVEQVASAVTARQLAADAAAAAAERERRFAAALREARAEPAADRESCDQAFTRAFEVFGAPLRDGDPTAQAFANASPVLCELVAAALDDWAARRKSLTRQDRRGPPSAGDGWQGLLHCAQAIDPDPQRSSLRRQILAGDTAALRRTAADFDIARATPGSVVLLAFALRDAGDSTGDADASIDILRRGFDNHPGDFWINLQLAEQLAGGVRAGPFGIETMEASGDVLEVALRHAWIAAALAGDSALAWERLASLLLAGERTDEAMQAAERALQLAPQRRAAALLAARVLVRRGEFVAAARCLDAAAVDNARPALGEVTAAVAASVPPAQRAAFLRPFFAAGLWDGRLEEVYLRALLVVGDADGVLAVGAEQGFGRPAAHQEARVFAWLQLGDFAAAAREADRIGQHAWAADARAAAAFVDGAALSPTASEREQLLCARARLAVGDDAAAADLYRRLGVAAIAASPLFAGAEAGGRPGRQAGGRPSSGDSFAVRTDLLEAAVVCVRAAAGGDGRRTDAAVEFARQCLLAALGAVEGATGRPDVPRPRGAPGLGIARLEAWSCEPALAVVREPERLLSLADESRAAWQQAWLAHAAALVEVRQRPRRRSR